MRERPVLFSAPMVRAILDGRKTQTRRLVKPAPYGAWMPSVGFYCPTLVTKDGEEYPGPEVFGAFDEVVERKCPFGPPGDRLWVKETWCTTRGLDHCKPTGLVEGAPVQYLADGWIAPHGMREKGKTRVSLFMRRWMSRITLDIVALRVERLQCITEADAMAEGVERSDFGSVVPPGAMSLDGGATYHPFTSRPVIGYHVGPVSGPEQTLGSARFAFANLWDRLNGPGAWDRNPWVWVLEFRGVAR